LVEGNRRTSDVRPDATILGDQRSADVSSGHVVSSAAIKWRATLEVSVGTSLTQRERPTLLWMECGACSGESMAILGAGGPDTLPDFLDRHHVQLLWHPSLSPEPPSEVAGVIEQIVAGEQDLTLLCVEGSIINGPDGTGLFDTFEGRPKRDVVAALCHRAEYVIAMGSCAAFGGIPAAPPNPSESVGLQFTNARPGGLLDSGWRSRSGLPVLNLSGCPVDSATMIETMGLLLDGQLLDLNRYQQPSTVRPCLATALEHKCATADKVGYVCYGCISARFPVNRALFRHHPVGTEIPVRSEPDLQGAAL
jgi:Ni,Fe-hydrogenase I small subunit